MEGARLTVVAGAPYLRKKWSGGEAADEWAGCKIKQKSGSERGPGLTRRNLSTFRATSPSFSSHPFRAREKSVARIKTIRGNSEFAAKQRKRESFLIDFTIRPIVNAHRGDSVSRRHGQCFL